MALKTQYYAESWQTIYQAFNQVNFSSYDFDTIKQSLIDYIRIYFPENYNDWIESSELLASIEAFAYIAEQLAYRMDMLSHEVFLTTAQRKQSILKLAKMISYQPSRNIAGRGLVKITSISTSERVIDSRGINLANTIIIWNDPNNSNWKEQFFLVMNRVLSGSFGQYSSNVQIGNVTMQLYTLNNTLNSVPNAVIAYTADTGVETFPMEIVPVLLDENGPFEKTPDINSQMSIIYSSDGLGDGSDYTGFLMYTKQGILSRLPYSITSEIPNRSLTLNPQNINETDVWINEVDSAGNIVSVWEKIDDIIDQNLYFNTNTNRKKFSVETLENDAIKILFGDGDFSDIPVGDFHIWYRQSANASLILPASKLVNHPIAFQYLASNGLVENASMTFSLISTIQNSSASESIEHIRQSAPSTYYAQNRMVNAQDYNTFMLKDQSILRLSSINRTFAGQPKYIEWNDASGQYQNIKLFGDDLQLSYTMGINSISTGNTVSSRSLIDEIIEPLLSSTGIINLLNHISATDPETAGVISLTRRSFIEDNKSFYLSDIVSGLRENRQEKTLIQGAIDQHWYGEPVSYTSINNISYAIIEDPLIHPEDDSKIWLDTVPRTIDGITPYIPGDVGSGLQPLAWQEQFGLCFNRSTPMIGTDVSISGTILSRVSKDSVSYLEEVFTIEVAQNGQLLYVSSNIRGKIGNGEVGSLFSLNVENNVIDFTLLQSESAVYSLFAGDAYVIRLPEVLKSDWDNLTLPLSFTESTSDSYINVSSKNLLGKWELIDGVDLISGVNQINPNTLGFDPQLYLPNSTNRNPNSWIIWVKASLNPVTRLPTSFTVHYRELKLEVRSQNTKFWYNSSEQIIDSITKNRVFDLIRILRSNLTSDGRALGHNENYDVVGPVIDQNGIIDFHSLEIIPSDMLNIDTSGNTLPDNVLQYEQFVSSEDNNSSHYYYFPLDNNGLKNGDEISRDDFLLSFPSYSIDQLFNEGSFVSNQLLTDGLYWGRTLKRKELDFMWQHYTPQHNLIDPSVSNIHDTYILTQGYYNSISNYLQGKISYLPSPPTPLELRNQYSHLLDNKMLSDTIVLHPGKIKLLFGSQAEPQLRAIFKVVKSASASLSNERIISEVLNVINTFFNISNWDFGNTFYATELFGLIHQRLATEIASVVLVPVYAVNSFGSLFTIKSGIDEILQSAATLNDIEIVSELNATTLRQSGIA
jgi:hypothetical protein